MVPTISPNNRIMKIIQFQLDNKHNELQKKIEFYI